MTGARTVPWLNQEIRAASLRVALWVLLARMMSAEHARRHHRKLVRG